MRVFAINAPILRLCIGIRITSLWTCDTYLKIELLTMSAHATILHNEFEIYILELLPHLSWANELNQSSIK